MTDETTNQDVTNENDQTNDANAETKKTGKEKVNQPKDARIAPSGPATPVSRETASHQYQEASPAINTNVVAGYAADSDSILTKLDTPENLKAREDAAKVQNYQHAAIVGQTLIDCSVLDVSNPLYCHVGSPRHLEYLNSIKK